MIESALLVKLFFSEISKPQALATSQGTGVLIVVQILMEGLLQGVEG